VLTQRLLSQLLEDPGLISLARQFESGMLHLALTGITPAAKPAYLALLERLLRKPILFVGSDNQGVEEFKQATAFYQQLVSEETARGAAALPATEPGPYSGVPPHAEVLAERVLALWEVLHSKASILLCPLASFMARLPDLERVFARIPCLQVGSEIEPHRLMHFLIEAGYVREEPVTTVGSFSIRGGVFDIFPPNSTSPVRLEFFGDLIESIREFSVKSQRSIGQVRGVTPVPMRELLIDEDLLRVWAEAAGRTWDPGTYEAFFANQVARAQNGEYFQGFEALASLVIPYDWTLPGLLKNCVVVLDEPGDLKRQTVELAAKWEDDYQECLARKTPALPPSQWFLTESEVEQALSHRTVVFLDQLGISSSQVNARFSFQTAPVRKYHGNIRELAKDLCKQTNETAGIVFVQSTAGKAERLLDVLKEYDLEVVSDFSQDKNNTRATEQASYNKTTIIVGNVLEGFQNGYGNLFVYGEEDIFDEIDLLARPSRGKSKSSSFASDFRELKPGDYVVHIDHGIGHFQGIKEIVAGGVSREFMILNYFGGDKLYVPLERLDLIQKHSSGENVRLQLDKLGGTTWAKTKSRIKKSMRDMADDLLKLYAARRITPGFSFSAQGHWHQEFADAFEYTETPDQLTTIADVLRDMEEEVPMDRLLCGDVGFGKTEVAMRAAFKACYDGKQVAVLAPTTILVYQHYLLFKQRFTAFPMNIEMLSRFRSRKEQQEILARLATGKVDIIIGTHRLLSKDIQFHDLGLLVIDEEQQFGVAHKEKLKQLKKHVDTLTMSATPIPRTLHMSLAGIRDMSIIETPPKDRLAIQTVVVPFSKQVVLNAIQHELARGGQVYFVHNKVESIYSVASMLQKICPQARIVVGHGQMKERELELAMLRFVSHEADILVSTTIIENGLDIPLVNTIVVNRADCFGLAQLYQLRGRVGRSNRRAYAYLLIPPDGVLTGEARQRLAALKEFSALGSGFKIAALDLELRGAGNLLGGEQHGHINAIGFDLYCQMLEKTIEEMRGLEALPEVQTQINLRITVKIPTEYIFDENQRLQTYKRISSMKSEAEIHELRLELEDRYGPLPQEVESLIEYSRLRLAAERLLIQSIEREKDGITIKFHEKTPISPQRLVDIVSSNAGVVVTPKGLLKIHPAGLRHGEMFSFVRGLLQELAA
jgi:transcription-repair coupling factor (superfamily II helicase)